MSKIVKIGRDPIHHGKKLLPLLCNLKNFGRGRIVYSTLEQQFSEPSFYRILLAQPEMDEEMRYGRIVAERVYRGKRYMTPFNVAGKQMMFPDYRLVAKDEEEEFCRWDEVTDYDPKEDAPPRSRFMEVPPLLRIVMERARRERGETVADENFLLPAHKIYEGDVRLTDDVEPNDMSVHLKEEFATHKGFDMNLIPIEDWNERRMTAKVGRREWPSYTVGFGSFGYEVLLQREQEAAEAAAKAASEAAEGGGAEA